MKRLNRCIIVLTKVSIITKGVTVMENQKEDKRKAIILLFVALIAIVAMIAGATYAYFQAQQGKGQSSDVNVTTGTTDNLNFNITDLDVTRTDIVDEDNEEMPITINASMENFTDKNTNLGDGVTATATLIANDATNEAEGNYYVYLNITKNELQYSSYKRNNPLEPDTDNKNTLVFKTEEEKSAAELGEYSPIPELYLTIKKNGTEIISGVTISGKELNHVEGILVDPDNEENPTSKTLGGFDITETKGLIKIEDQQTINVLEETENHTTTDTWEIIVTFMNLDTDQNLNTGKKLEGRVLIQQELIPTNLADVCSAEDKAGECVQELASKSNYKLTNIVYHNTLDATEKEIPNATKVAGDNSYRYVGANPNNYVCFGDECSNEGDNPNYKNLYRIIGFFQNDSGQYEMKIIKADAATKDDLGDKADPDGSAYSGDDTPNQSSYKGKLKKYGYYYWNSTDSAHLTVDDSTNTNMWKDSNLNTKNLNEKFYNAIDETYKSMVVEHEWQVGAAWNMGDAKSVYDYELGDNKLTATSKNCYVQGGDQAIKDQIPVECNGANDLTYKDEVGLMYISDYMYGTLPEYWSETAGNYNKDDVKNNNWLYLGLYEWTISRFSDDGSRVRHVYTVGSAHNATRVYYGDGVRPVVYLSSNVKITSGFGTDSDPFKLAI